MKRFRTEIGMSTGMLRFGAAADCRTLARQSGAVRDMEIFGTHASMSLTMMAAGCRLLKIESATEKVGSYSFVELFPFFGKAPTTFYQPMSTTYEHNEMSVSRL